MTQCVLVTGGAGFIGSHTVDLLLANNKRVIVWDNLTSGALANLNLNHPALQFIEADILNYPRLCAEIKKCDAVLHLAALPSVPQSIKDPLTSLQVNLQGFLHVLQAIREHHPLIRLVYASSAAVYGDACVLPCDDEVFLAAPSLSPYALEKANNERYAALYAHLFGLRSLGLRYFNVYGPRQLPQSHYSGVISKFIKRYQEKQPLHIFGDGKQSRDFINVQDVARANVLALESDYCGVLNIATGVPETLLNLVAYIKQAGDTSVEIEFSPVRPGDITHSYATIEKAAKYLGFRYSTSLQQGIQSLIKISYDSCPV